MFQNQLAKSGFVFIDKAFCYLSEKLTNAISTEDGSFVTAETIFSELIFSRFLKEMEFSSMKLLTLDFKVEIYSICIFWYLCIRDEICKGTKKLALAIALCVIYCAL